MVPSGLRERLRAAIQAGGPLRFDRFMARALYEPGLGYYTRPGARVGRSGDFVTSPSMSPAFGRTLARLARLVRAAAGDAARFRIVDAGAGEGGLLAPLLGELARESALAGVEAVVVERGPELRERAWLAASATGAKVQTLDEVARLGELEPMAGLVLANELLDALPVRRLRKRTEGVEESHVVASADGKELIERWLTVADVSMPDALPVGVERTIAPGLSDLVRELAHPIERGLLLIVDYGWPARLIDRPESGGNALRGFRAGRLVDDLVADPGEIDLTAHVDFTAAARAGAASDLTTAFFTDQTYLLLGLGFLDDPDAAAARRLIHPEDLGGVFKCLGLARDLAPGTFRPLELRDRRTLLAD